MKLKIFLGFIGVILLFLGLSLGMGWFNVFYTGTVEKAQQNVERDVYEQSNSFTKGKRMEAIKLYHEYQECKTNDEKEAIATIARMSFADFDEDKYIRDYQLRQWIKSMKY